MNWTGRIDAARAAFRRDGLQGLVIGRPANVRYLTGHPAEPARPSCVVLNEDRSVLVAPAASTDASHGLEVITYPVPGATINRVVDVSEACVEALEHAVELVGLNDCVIGCDDGYVSARQWSAVSAKCRVRACLGYVEDQRRIKDPDELELIRVAVQLNDLAFAAAQSEIREGVSEIHIEESIVHAMQSNSGALIDVSPDTNCMISGPRTVGAVGLATPRLLEKGDLFIIDLNPYLAGYKGDTTRTFCVGQPSDQHRRMFDAVLSALESAEAVLRPGIAGRDVYAAMIEPILRAGLGEGLSGHGGHAIGLEHLERPFIIPGEDMLIAEGMVLTLEPGIYLPSVGGIRLEDNYLVTAAGTERLSHFPRDLAACG